MVSGQQLLELLDYRHVQRQDSFDFAVETLDFTATGSSRAKWRQLLKELLVAARAGALEASWFLAGEAKQKGSGVMQSLSEQTLVSCESDCSGCNVSGHTCLHFTAAHCCNAAVAANVLSTLSVTPSWAVVHA